MMIENTIRCTSLHKAFGATAVVRNVSFTLEKGQILVLLGPSGCGKTTTLRLIAGFEQLDAGVIEIAGQLVANGRFNMPPEKRRVGMVFQDYAIFPHMSVGENIAFGLGRDKKQARQRTAEMLAMVGLPTQGVKMPHELSGGQQQRVALARAMALDPAILLLDEPFSNLDTSLRQQVRSDVRQVLQKNGATAVFVTHDQEEALFLGDQIAVMANGCLEQIGIPETIYHQPQTRFVAEFMGQTDFLAGRVTAVGIETPLGTLTQTTTLPVGTSVEIALRADDVVLTANEGGNGRIVDRQFIGIAHIYEIALADGTRLHSWQPHTHNLSAGTAVQVTLNQDHPLSYFPIDE